MSFDEKNYNCFDSTKLTLSETDTLNGWFEFMKKRYKIVAQIGKSKKDD